MFALLGKGLAVSAYALCLLLLPVVTMYWCATTDNDPFAQLSGGVYLAVVNFAPWIYIPHLAIKLLGFFLPSFSGAKDPVQRLADTLNGIALITVPSLLGALVGHGWRTSQIVDFFYFAGSFFFGAVLVIFSGWLLFLESTETETAPFEFPEATKTASSFTQAPTARANPAAIADAREEHFPFEMSKPGAGLVALAGMAALKQELMPVLAGFHAYRTGTGPINDRNGILLSGPPGNGKSATARALAGELNLPLFHANVQDLTSQYISQSPQVIKSLFKQAAKQPCVIFFDEFDAVARKRDTFNMSNEDRKTVNALLSEIDAARSKRVVIIAATNFVEDLDPAIARDGRFDFRIDIPYPDAVARRAILTGLLATHKVDADIQTIGHVADLWQRRSIAFMESTVKRMRDMRKEKMAAKVFKLGNVVHQASTADFKLAARLASRRQSAIPAEGPKLSELVLPASVRIEADSLLYRLRNWEKITEQGAEPPSGVLLYGPPGTGKTNFVRALARELQDWHVFEVNATDVIRDPRKFKDVVELAAQHRPAFVFIDEADELLADRSYSGSAGATNEILKSMDGLLGKIPEVVFIAATNNPDALDAAAVRGGRFGEKIFMPRLQGEDLVRFLQGQFEERSTLRIASDLTASSMAALLQEAAPSDAIAIFRKAVGYCFGADGARPVTRADVARARDAMA